MNIATVETLTAEVRVLMVGNRQVTLSVYRQLDQFDLYSYPLDSFEPFGRVSSGTRYEDEDRRGRTVKLDPHWEFVGRLKETGALVRLVVMRSTVREKLIDDYEITTLAHWGESLPLIVLAGLR